MKKGMVFGVFDRFHDGHKYFLDEAAQKCDELVVVVTLPEIVEIIKKKLPKDSFETRVKNIHSLNSTWKIIPGDEKLGSWQVLKEHQPDIVFLGYDQHGIAQELKKLNIPFSFIESHFPEKFKSSLMS